MRACKHRLSWAPFDRARYEQVRSVAAGILVSYTEVDAALSCDLLHREQGYATPRMDVRGAVCDASRSQRKWLSPPDIQQLSARMACTLDEPDIHLNPVWTYDYLQLTPA